jgi:methylase of polypeptide subunit release factors
MEIGYNQAPEVSRLFEAEIWKKLDILPDLQGIPRMVKAQIAA